MNQHGSKWIRPEKRLALYLRDGWRCTYCQCDLSTVSPEERGLDHLRPRSKGGSHHEANLATTCRPCNSRRQDQPLTRFATPEAVARARRQARRSLRRYRLQAASLMAEVAAGKAAEVAEAARPGKGQG